MCAIISVYWVDIIIQVPLCSVDLNIHDQKSKNLEESLGNKLHPESALFRKPPPALVALKIGRCPALTPKICSKLLFLSMHGGSLFYPWAQMQVKTYFWPWASLPAASRPWQTGPHGRACMGTRLSLGRLHKTTLAPFHLYYSDSRAGGNGPAAPVLAGPVFLKVKNKSIFAKSK